MSGRMYDERERLTEEEEREQEYKITDALGNEWVIIIMPNGGLNIMAYGRKMERGLSFVIKPKMGNSIELYQIDLSGVRSPD